MPKISVRLYTALKDRAGQERYDLTASNVAQLLKKLSAELPEAAREGMFDDSGKVRGRFTLCLNTAMLNPREFGKIKLQEGDTVHVMPPIAGG